MASDDDDQTANLYLEQHLFEEDDDESNDDDHTLNPQQVDEDDVDLIDDEEDDSMSSAAGEVTIAVASIPNTTTTITPTPTTTITTTSDASRRLFQRLWTDEDEIELLQGFRDYTAERGIHHHDTTAFYDQIKGKLQLDFNKNQLVEKLRRLKRKYRNVVSKISSGKEYVFKSPHDQATFELSSKIWSETAAAIASVAVDSVGIDDEEPQNPNPNPNPNSNFGFNLNEHNVNEIADPDCSDKKVARSRKRSRSTGVKLEENYNEQVQYGQNAGAGVGASNLNSDPVTSNLVEETVKNSLLPLFKELVSNSASGSSRGLGLMNMDPFGGSVNIPIGDMSDDKWRKQHMLELEVYSKRLELMQDQVKSRLEELRSMGN